MVINMDEAQIRTIKQVEEFLSGSAPIEFSAAGHDTERYEVSQWQVEAFQKRSSLIHVSTAEAKRLGGGRHAGAWRRIFGACAGG